MTHPPGLIGVLGGDISRFARFYECLLAEMAPEGTDIFPIRGLWIADAINGFIEVMKPQHRWLQIWANDHGFHPDILLRLLAHNVPLVAPLCVLRSPPNNFSLFHEVGDAYQSYHLAELQGKRGLLPVDAYGGPGMVIRREVIEALGQPFFQCDPRHRTNPREDLYTVSRIRQAGFQPYCDLDTRISHLTVLEMWPTRTPAGEYGVSYYEDTFFLGSLFAEDMRKRHAKEMAEQTDPLYHVFID